MQDDITILLYVVDGPGAEHQIIADINGAKQLFVVAADTAEEAVRHVRKVLLDRIIKAEG